MHAQEAVAALLVVSMMVVSGIMAGIPVVVVSRAVGREVRPVGGVGTGLARFLVPVPVRMGDAREGA